MYAFSPFLTCDVECHPVTQPILHSTFQGHHNHFGVPVALFFQVTLFHPLTFSSSPIYPFEFLQLARSAIQLPVSSGHLQPDSCLFPSSANQSCQLHYLPF